MNNRLPLQHHYQTGNKQYGCSVLSQEMFALAQKVKSRQVSQEEIDVLVDFTKQNGGIEYAVQMMNDYAQKAKDLLASFPDSDVKQALFTYVDYVVGRSI